MGDHEIKLCMSSSSWKVEFQFSQYSLPKTEPADCKDADEIII